MKAEDYLLLGGIALLPLLPLLILYLWKLRKFAGSGWIFLAATAFQILCLWALWKIFLENLPSSAAAILLGILLAYCAIGVVIGLLLCPICYFLATRPERWQRKILRTLSAYAAVALLVCLPMIATKLGFGANVELHGRVTNTDGSPLANAMVHFADCPYIAKNPAVTDKDGRFQVKAKCGDYFKVAKIYNPATRTECLSRFTSEWQIDRGLLVFDNLRGEHMSESRPHWRDHGANNPFPFHCVWHRPKSLLKKYVRLRLDATSSTRVLNLNADDFEELLQGDGEVGLRYDADGGTLAIRALDGGVQRARSTYGVVNVAPTEGYADQLKIDLSPFQERHGGEALFFKAGYTYGYIALRLEQHPDFLELDLEYLFNPEGGVNLVAHDLNAEPIYRQPAEREIAELGVGL
jgi:hypothetical protein